MKLLKHKSNCNGFTLVELLIAMTITAIIVGAVATFAYALSSANSNLDDTSEKQAQLRYTTLRISELIKHSKLICKTSSSELAIWKSDDNDDGQINPAELVYLTTNADRNEIVLLEISASGFWAVQDIPISEIQTGTAKNAQLVNGVANYIQLVPDCSGVRFTYDAAAPQTRTVTVYFNLTENGTTNGYQVGANLRGWAGNLLNEYGQLVSQDDD